MATNYRENYKINTITLDAKCPVCGTELWASAHTPCSDDKELSLLYVDCETDDCSFPKTLDAFISCEELNRTYPIVQITTTDIFDVIDELRKKYYS